MISESVRTARILKQSRTKLRRVPVAALPDLSIRQLEYLVAIADAPTWAVAASQVGVSPSALSQGLAELERRVGVDLFERHGRRRLLRPSALPVLGQPARWSPSHAVCSSGPTGSAPHVPDVCRWA